MPDDMAFTLAIPPVPGGTATALSHAPSPARPHGWLRAWLGDMWRCIARQRDIRRAIAELDAMDERMLRDIGLDRAQALHMVRFGRA